MLIITWKGEKQKDYCLLKTGTTSSEIVTRVQKATPVGGTVQIKQLIVVPDRVLSTRDFVLQKYRTQFVSDYTRTVHQLTGLTGQNMEVLNQPYSGQLAYSIRLVRSQSVVIVNGTIYAGYDVKVSLLLPGIYPWRHQ